MLRIHLGVIFESFFLNGNGVYFFVILTIIIMERSLLRDEDDDGEIIRISFLRGRFYSFCTGKTLIEEGDSPQSHPLYHSANVCLCGAAEVS